MISGIAVRNGLVFAACGLLVLGGCVSQGDEQNYKLLEEDRPPFEAEPSPMSSETDGLDDEADTQDWAGIDPATGLELQDAGGHGVGAEVAAGEVDAAIEAERVVDEGDGVRIDAPVVEMADTSGEMQTPQEDAADELAELYPNENLLLGSEQALARSVDGLDRSQWPVLTVGPAGGTTHHHPVYFADLPVNPSARPGVSADDPIEAQLDAALAGNEAGNLNLLNVLDALIQPVKFGLDGALVGPAQVIAPVWSDATTP